MPLDDATRALADDLVEALRPLEARARPMFGGYCFYVDEKVVGLVCDGRVFVKRSGRDDLLRDFAELAPAYPGARDSWRLPAASVRDEPERIHDIIEQVAAVLPSRKRRPRS